MNEERKDLVASAVYRHLISRHGDPMTVHSIPEAVAHGIEVALGWERPEVSPEPWGAEAALDVVLRFISEQSSWRLRHQGSEGQREWEVLKERVANILGAWESRRGTV